jgi:hypothetical protein
MASVSTAIATVVRKTDGLITPLPTRSALTDAVTRMRPTTLIPPPLSPR